jgi:hypothetical protein
MMYEVNKFSFEIKEAPDVSPLTKHFVGKHISSTIVLRRGKDTEWNYYAETMQEAEAKVAELKAKKIEDLKKQIEYHESQALYAKSRLMAIASEIEKTEQP